MEKAAELFARAADQDYPRAQFFLGLHYEHGQGVEKDMARAVRLYAKAAEQNYPEGVRALGVC